MARGEPKNDQPQNTDHRIRPTYPRQPQLADQQPRETALHRGHHLTRDPEHPTRRSGGAKPSGALLKAGALQSAIFDSANFSSIATDANGVIQIFNVGAERMLGYTAAEVVNRITLADIADPQEVIARAKALSVERGTPVTPGFEALMLNASRGIEDIYELTYIRKDGSQLPAVVSVSALRDARKAIVGYLLIGTDNTARKQVEEERMKLDQRPRSTRGGSRSPRATEARTSSPRAFWGGRCGPFWPMPRRPSSIRRWSVACGRVRSPSGSGSGVMPPPVAASWRWRSAGIWSRLWMTRP